MVQSLPFMRRRQLRVPCAYSPWFPSACLATLAGCALVQLATCTGRSFAAWPSRLRPERPSTGRIQRRFFESLTPGYWQKQTFVCKVIDDALPEGKPGQLMTVLDIEPVGSDYWAYLKPLDAKWYLENIIAIGGSIVGMDDGKLSGMKNQAGAIGAKSEFIQWDKSTMPFGIQKASIDMVFVTEGAFKRLGPRKEAAIRNARMALKNSGHFIFVVDEEDERALGGRLEKDFYGECVMDRHGFEIVTSTFEHGVRAGFMKKKPIRATKGGAKTSPKASAKTSAKTKRSMPRTKSPRAY